MKKPQQEKDPRTDGRRIGSLVQKPFPRVAGDVHGPL